MGLVWITGKTWLSVSISEDYQLQSFPFDQQSLKVEIELPNAVHIEPMPASAKPGRAWGAQLLSPVLVHREGVEHLPGKRNPFAICERCKLPSLLDVLPHVPA